MIKFAFFGNAHEPIDSTVDGYFIFFKEVHPLNVFSLIDFTREGIFISINDEQLWNAYLPILSTDVGIMKSDNKVHPSKA